MQEEKTFGLGMKIFVPILNLIALAGFRRLLPCAECWSNFRSGEVEFQTSYGAFIPMEFQTSYGAFIPIGATKVLTRFVLPPKRRRARII